jgi:hypothetical protein
VRGGGFRGFPARARRTGISRRRGTHRKSQHQGADANNPRGADQAHESSITNEPDGTGWLGSSAMRGKNWNSKMLATKGFLAQTISVTPTTIIGRLQLSFTHLSRAVDQFIHDAYHHNYFHVSAILVSQNTAYPFL